MTNLDFLVIVAGGLAVAAVLTVAGLFLFRKERGRRAAVYLAAGLGLYLGYVGVRINYMSFEAEALAAVVLALAGVAAVVVERGKQYNAARILAAVSVLGGMVNAFV